MFDVVLMRSRRPAGAAELVFDVPRRRIARSGVTHRARRARAAFAVHADTQTTHVVDKHVIRIAVVKVVL